MVSSIICIFCYSLPSCHLDDANYLPPFYLVKTKTIRVWRAANENFDRGRLRVITVIAGPERLKNREFEATTEWAEIFGMTPGPSKRYPDTHVFPLKAEVEGLWWVDEEGKDQSLRPVLDGDAVHLFGLQEFPYQRILKHLDNGKRQDASWREGEQFAKAVAEVYAAKSDRDRFFLLTCYAATEDSPISTWAIALLARGHDESTMKLFRELAKKNNLDARAQMMLDELLCRFETEKWSGSAERNELLTRWLDAKSKDNLFSEACLRLQLARSDDLDVDLFVDVVGKAVIQSDQMSRLKQIDLSNLLRLSSYWFEDKEGAKQKAFLERMKSLTKSDFLKKQIERELNRLPK